MRTMLDVSAALAEGDGSTSWVVTLVNVCNWLTSLFPGKAQDDVFGANPEARVTGVLSPTSTAVKAEQPGAPADGAGPGDQLDQDPGDDHGREQRYQHPH